ncbi:MAG: DUF4402 domain-containing protein [Bacteroidales bacterium]|jgi:hypothetical protein|nr:DUF4402 domain-containing protein [Bacteroidales bacterium]
MLKKILKISIIMMINLLPMGLSAQGWFIVNITSNLNFGTFYPVGDGGKVIIDNSGTRQSEGNIVLMPSSSSSCSFTTRNNRNSKECNVQSATVQSSVNLIRDGGNGSMKLELNKISPSNWIIEPKETVTVSFGGILYVGPISSNPPGIYSGSFEISLNFE